LFSSKGAHLSRGKGVHPFFPLTNTAETAKAANRPSLNLSELSPSFRESYSGAVIKKSPCSSAGALLVSPANQLDGLKTATFLTMGYRANTKSFSPHWRNLLSNLSNVTVYSIYNFPWGIVNHKRIYKVFFIPDPVKQAKAGMFPGGDTVRREWWPAAGFSSFLVYLAYGFTGSEKFNIEEKRTQYSRPRRGNLWLLPRVKGKRGCVRCHIQRRCS